VGFGDIITAHSDGVRAIVSVQMLLDLVVLGGLVRLLFRAARTGLSRGEYADPEHR
jgi:voltage-gated potassium channel